VGARHMLRYHILIPLAIVVVLLVIGVPLGTAFVIGMMTGCMSMMLMMAASARGQHRRGGEHHDIGR
jgi:hypothetical protein